MGRTVTFLSLTLFSTMLAQTSFSMTLNDVLSHVATSNPNVVASQKSIEVADEGVKQERADMLPSLIATGSYTNTKQEFDTGTDTDFTPKVYGATLTQTLFAGGGEYNGYRSAQYLSEEARQNYQSFLQDTLNATASAYINVLTAKEVLDLQANQVKLLQEQQKLTNARFDQGEVTKTDVKQAEARLALAIAAKIQAKGSYRTARTALQNLVGMHVDDVSWPVVNYDLPTEYSLELRDEVFEVHPDVLAAKAVLESSKKQVKTARSVYFPRVSAVASYTDYEDSASGDYTNESIGVQVSLPLFEGGRNVSGVRESISLREQARQIFEQSKRDVDQNLFDAIELYNTAVASLKAFKESEAAAIIAEKGVENEQMLGERTVLDLLDARQELLEARVNVAIAKGDVIARTYALLEAMGRLEI